VSILRRSRSVFLGAAVFASAVACLAAALGASAMTAVLSALPAILVLAALKAKRTNRSSNRDAFLEKMVEQAETGRKMAIYDRKTGLFAYWYMTLRGEEECSRAGRYGRPLTLLVAEPAPESNAWAVDDAIALWLRQKLRAADVAGSFGNARSVIIMPETGIDQADIAAARLRGDCSEARAGVSAFPDDGTTFEQLYAVALGRLSECIDPDSATEAAV
jgi:GGDEF domain-containing protein